MNCTYLQLFKDGYNWIEPSFKRIEPKVSSIQLKIGENTSHHIKGTPFELT